MKFIGRDYQAVVPSLVIDFFTRKPKGHPLIAIPTGGGKTPVICLVVEEILDRWPNIKITIISHVKEILEQDHNALSRHLDIEVGLNSAGLGRRDNKQITVAGIQSVYKNVEEFQKTQLVIIDEAHLIPPSGEGMYRTFLNGLKRAKYLGVTATPYRLGQGLIYSEGALFTDLIYDLTTMDAFNKLVDDGWLSPLRTKETTLEMNTDDLHIRGGDFIDTEMSVAFDIPTVTNKAIEEIIECGADYKKWLIFAIDIEHAEHITERLLQSGIRAMVVHSRMEMNRADIIDGFKSGRYRALVNVNILTTGFDVPDIDLIALLRPTQSPNIHVQTIGRGLRIADGKDHCLVLDFAGNTARLGPINNVTVKKRKKGEGGEPITKTCPDCGLIYHPTAKTCTVCGHVFQFKIGISSSAGGDAIIASNAAKWKNVDTVTYSLHEKPNSPTSVLVRYHCGLQVFKEWICVEHNGFAGHKAKHWMGLRLGAGKLPENAADLLGMADQLSKPRKIKVKTANKYPEIVDIDLV